MSILTSVEITFTFADNTETHASIYEDAGWQQWGNDTEHLGFTVDYIDEISLAAYNSGLFVDTTS